MHIKNKKDKGTSDEIFQYPEVKRKRRIQQKKKRDYKGMISEAQRKSG